MIAVALALDAFAVALAGGVLLPEIGWRRTFRLSWHFGLFQALMTILGWYFGGTFREFIEKWDHWTAFALLAFVGGKMIYEGMGDHQAEEEFKDPSKGFSLIMLSIATSIDAAAVGLSFSLLSMDIRIPALIIGLVALVLTAVGLHLGRYLGTKTRLDRYAELAGGTILISIGFKILYEHGVF